MSYSKFLVSQIVNFARANNRSARQARRDGSKVSAAHAQGRAQAYMVAARMMSQTTSAVTRNFRRAVA